MYFSSWLSKEDMSLFLLEGSLEESRNVLFIVEEVEWWYGSYFSGVEGILGGSCSRAAALTQFCIC